MDKSNEKSSLHAGSVLNKTVISDSSSKINSVIGFFDRSKIDEPSVLRGGEVANESADRERLFMTN